MLTIFRNTVLSLMRDRIHVMWALIFPIILGLIFMSMFSGIAESYRAVRMDLGVVESENVKNAPAFNQFLDRLSDAKADEQLASIVRYASEEDAVAATNEGTVQGYLTMDEDGTPQLHVAASMNGELKPSVMKAALDSYLRTSVELADVAQDNPQALANGSALAAFSPGSVATTELQVTKATPDATVRYFYSLLGMAAGMGMMLSVLATKRMQPTASNLGTRSVMAGMSRWRVLLATVLGAWACELVCLCALYLFLWLVAGVNFGNEPGWVLAAMAVSSLMSCALGSALGTIPHLETGMVSGIVCLLSLFTGLYGPGAQRLADSFEASAPLFAHLNPFWQMANGFYALLYYDSLGPFFERCTAMLAMTVVFFAIASLRMRRLSHAHL